MHFDAPPLSKPNGYLFEETAELQQVLHALGIQFCFIGDVALQHWGEVRQTTDIDLNLYCELGRALSQEYGLTVPLRICSAEDLVITMNEAGRGQDWVDIDRIIQRSGETMNWP